MYWTCLKCIDSIAPVQLYAPCMYIYIYVFVYSLLTSMLNTIQATASDLRGQITTLQAALEGARNEVAARKEHEVELASQFQVCLCC